MRSHETVKDNVIKNTVSILIGSIECYLMQNVDMNLPNLFGRASYYPLNIFKQLIAWRSERVFNILMDYQIINKIKVTVNFLIRFSKALLKLHLVDIFQDLRGCIVYHTQG